MKKLFRPIIQICAIGGVFLLSNCAKNGGVGPGGDCSANAQKVTEAGEAYGKDFNNPAKCQAYKKAIGDFLKSCPTYWSAAVKKQMEDDLKDLCNN